MTIVRITTADQLLVISQKPKLASGDIESVMLQVDFDVNWDIFPAKSAVFHTSNDSTVYERLLTNDECIVPKEVLTKPGTLYIGLRGMATDGSAVKTSVVVKMSIVQGAESSISTSNPTPDMYQQYLAAMDEKLDPHLLNYKNSMDKKLAEQSQEVTKTMNELMASDVVWENPDTTQMFEGQTIPLDLSAYKRFDIIFKVKNDTDTYYQHSCNKKNVKYNYYEYITTASTTYRGATITDSGIEFDNAAAPGVYNNYWLIPVEVIGYKY